MEIVAGSVHLPSAPPSPAAMFGWNPQPLPLLPLVGIVLAGLYIWGVRRVLADGRAWPWWRTACFLTGCAVLVAVTGLAIEGYGFELFSAFMFQHLTLSILIPPLWVLGSPGVLLLRATAHHGAGRIVLGAALSGLRRRPARVLLHPAVTVPLFLFSYYGVYLTPVLDTVGSWLAGHLALEVFFLLSGLLFIVPVLSTGPLPVRQTNLGRFFDIFVEMPLHVFIGLVLMMSTLPMVGLFTDPPAAWGVDPISDQHLAGALAWSYGEPVALVVVTVFAMRWYRDEQRENAVRERFPVHADAELDAYNAYLRGLHTKSPGGRR
ncbi:cytochrome c oxidase assembly protein [Nocardia yamanashiensis]|uniref:cytochrome c oxidase assembly protein n=1 Tax=Nocardia yamanashiensis TaxID=209247 RepID=UPI0008367492|nr:cytochrome c oxidase assembly protein [Nocardia yamanashiensis]